jgi:hypothetical protein
MMRLLLLAILLAYIPSAGSLLKHTASRAQALGRTREVTLTGTLAVSGEAPRPAQMVLRFPLQCRLDGEGGLSFAVRGTAARPSGAAEGTFGPALQLLQLSCPFLAYRGLSSADADTAFRALAASVGADLAAGSALARMEDRVAYVLGAGPGDTARPQLWLYKDTGAPARLIGQGGLDLRLLQYGSPAAGDWFPRVLELWTSGQVAARFEVLEAKGVRAASEEEEDDSRE